MLAAGANCADWTRERVVLGRKVGARTQVLDLTTDRADLITAARNIFGLS